MSNFIKSVLSWTLAFSWPVHGQVQGQTEVRAYRVFSRPVNVAEARLTIAAAEKRTLTTVSALAEQNEFTALVYANKLVGLIDQPEEYLSFWAKNKLELIASAAKLNKPINWQLFLAQTYLQFKIESTNAVQNPNRLLQWWNGAIDNEWIRWSSTVTWTFLVGAAAFVGGVTYGAMVAGPAAGAVNAGLNPVITPLNQKLTVLGNKYFGRVGMWFTARLFDNSLVDEASLKDAKSGVAGVRSIVEGQNYVVDAEKWARNMKSLYKVWNATQYEFNLMPDVYKSGRDRVADLALNRLRDNAVAASNSITAAEVQRQTADGLMDRLIMKGANVETIERLGHETFTTIEEVVRLEFDDPERTQQLEGVIENQKNEFIKLGAAHDQAERIIESMRKTHVFRRQAATVLAAQTLHDAMFSDTIQATRQIYNELFKNHSLNYLHAELKVLVTEVLERVEFQIEVKLNILEVQSKQTEMKSRLEKTNAGSTSNRVLSLPGSLTEEKADSPEGRARDAAARAVKR